MSIRVITPTEFWAQVEKTDDCWLWRGRTTSRGYGQVWNGQIWTGAHRHAYETTVAPIPEGMLICHKCDNPICVRPDHLFPGTNQDNVRDMMAKGRARLTGRPPEPLKSHCPNGHAMTPENVATWGGKYRHCRECNRIAVRRRRKEIAA